MRRSLFSGSDVVNSRCTVGLLLFVSTLSASGQEGPPLGDPFVESIDVNVVNVEVYVTDKRGKRVLGLTRDDFELRVDQRPVAITNFYSVEGRAGVRSETAQPRARSGVDSSTPPDVDSSTPPDDQRLHLVIYVDNLNLHPLTRNRTLRAVRSFLRTHLGPGDRVMLVTYDRSLHLRHGFTDDPERIVEQLYEIEKHSAHAGQRDSQRREVLEKIEVAQDVYEVTARASNLAQEIENDLRFAVDALIGQVESLAGLPGRKAILYVSDGLPMFAAQDVFELIAERFDYQSALLEVYDHDLTPLFRRLTDKANASRVTFYTLDAAGLRVYTYMDAANLAGGSARADQTHFDNLQAPLRYLARGTGGLAILDTNDPLPMLQRVADDFSSYYSLGFNPSAGGEGRYHRLKVRLKGRHKGVRVRAREGYRSKSMETRMQEGTLAALNFGYQRNSLGVEIALGPQSHQSDGHYLVPIRIRIPIAKLSFVPQEGMRRGRVRLFLAAKDAEGRVSDVNDVTLPIDIAREQWEKRRPDSQTYEIKLRMRGGSHRLALGIRDEIGAVVGFVSQQVSIGAEGSHGTG